jgi:apolipoprotein N-acyltransferase
VNAVLARVPAPWLAAAWLSAVLFAASPRPGPLGALAVAAVALLVRAIRTAPGAAQAALAAAIAATGPAAVAASAIAPMAPWGSVLATLAFALPFATAGLLPDLAGVARPDRSGWRTGLLVAAGWCAVEAAVGSTLLLGAWAAPSLALGTALADGPLLGLAALGGVRGLSLLVLLAGGALATLPGARLRGAAIVTVAVAPLLAAAASPRTDPPAGRSEAHAPTLSLRLVQPVPTPQSMAAARLDAGTADAYAAFLREHLRGAAGEDRLVVWPEAALPAPWVDPASGAPPSPFPLAGDVLFGAATIRDGARYNSVLLWRGHRAEADVVADKRRLVPVTEAGLASGRPRPPTPWRDVRIAALICWEAAFPELARRAAREGATLLAIVANDAYAGAGAVGRLHLRMARLRAVESGLPLVFVQATGPSAAIAADGTLVARLASGRAGSLDVDLPSHTVATPFRRHGDLIGPGAAAACLLAVGRRVRTRDPARAKGGTA